MSALRPYVRSLGLAAWAAGAALAISAASGAQAAEVGCTKICAQIVQAIGDEIKEQIPLDCVQETGVCTGTGHFTTANARLPVTIDGSLVGETLTLKVMSGQTFFAPATGDTLVMPLTPGNPYQAAQFVVGQKSGDTPFANAGTSLTLTVIAQRQM